ncbi:hypothetical protein [Pseudomonas aeruginosa]|uniref:hypothetical protein n=1 Tax=Pseudomonas aeruginosa TaxID=287 RepID=UPI001E61F66D|nr:hypothetical protein [Pseudomonas aeruginosa]MCD2761375.1 hypothetical protein [Pseudomonas aeruginosa]HBP0991509.1 hypothetical protein [Pseudomonas aeruginosa]HBP1202104.1 hypothetical protein [Pseudomonas aeruginosa]
MATDPQLSEQIRREVAAAVAPLERKLEEQDEWMNGLFLALEDLLQALLRENPALVQSAIVDWQTAADRYELASQGLYPDETVQRLEPRKMLYRMLRATGALRHHEG